MTKPTSSRYPFTLAAGDDIRPNWSADYIRFETLPAGLLVGWNGAVPTAQIQGSQISGPDGENSLADVVIKNTTAGPLSGVLIYGRGILRVDGVTTLSGAVPLPTGAATEAKQDTGNASAATSAAKLTTLAAAGTETARGSVVTNNTVALNGKKSVAVLNRATSTGNVTITFSDASTLTLIPGEVAGWSVSDRLNTLTDISVTSPDATTYAVVAATE